MVEHLAFNQIVEGSIPSRPTFSTGSIYSSQSDLQSNLLATCPRCHGHLTDGHKCPRTRRSLVSELIVTALAGGFAAIVFLAVFDPHQLAVDLDGLMFATGALFALGVHQLFTWRRKR